MPLVYNLQHTNYVDRETGVEFSPVANPKVVRVDEDEVGREKRLIAHAQAEVEDGDALDYFRNRPHMFHVVEDGEDVEVAAGDQYEVQERTDEDGNGTGWYDVLGPDGEAENENALREDDARELADHLNEQVS